jgi:hypothetical protein
LRYTACDLLSSSYPLRCLLPAALLQVEIDVKQFKDIKDDAEFAQKLLKEELVSALRRCGCG